MNQKSTSQTQQTSMLDGFFAEWERLEQRQLEFTKEAIVESNKLMMAQMDYTMKLMAGYRSLATSFVTR